MQSKRHMIIFLAFLVLFYTSLGGVIHLQLARYASLVDNMYNRPLAVTKSTLTVARNVVRVSRNVKDMLLVSDLAHRKQRLAEIEQDERDTAKQIGVVLDRIQQEAGRVLVRKAIELIQTQKVLRERITTEIFSGDPKKADLLAREEGLPLMKQLEEALAKISNYADTQSMAYNIQSVTDLKRSKIVLICAGFIVGIFSVTFGAVAWRSLRSSLQRSRLTLTSAAKGPIDLSVNFLTPSPGQISEALNLFFEQLRIVVGQLQDYQNDLNARVAEVAGNQKNLSALFDENVAKLNTVMNKIVSMLDVHHNGQKTYKLPFDLLKQIKGDLNLLAQIASTKELLIERLKTEEVEAERDEMIESLIAHSKSMRENVDRTMRSVDGVVELLRSLLDRLDDLRTATMANQDVGTCFLTLKENTGHCEDLVQEIEATAKKMDALVKSFKLT